jgi:hypothetical protein
MILTSEHGLCVVDPLSERLLRGDFQPGDTVCVDCTEDKIIMESLVKETV